MKNKLKTLTQGQKGDQVIDKMARTFRTLCDYADWADYPSVGENAPNQDLPKDKEPQEKHERHFNPEPIGLHYNIQIHLPETTNMAVYDAIFQSLKRHLF